MRASRGRPREGVAARAWRRGARRAPLLLLKLALLDVLEDELDNLLPIFSLLNGLLLPARLCCLLALQCHQPIGIIARIL